MAWRQPAAPVGGETFGEMLRVCAEVTSSDAEFVWVPDAQLLARGVRQWSEMPLWRTFPGVWQVNARLKGLSAGEHLLRLRTSRSSFSEPFAIVGDPVFG